MKTHPFRDGRKYRSSFKFVDVNILHMIKRTIVCKLSHSKEMNDVLLKTAILFADVCNDAERHDCGIVRMERLKNVHSKTKSQNKRKNRPVANWSYDPLQEFVNYKSVEKGISFELIHPFLTSQTHHLCSRSGSRKQECFKCLNLFKPLL